MKYHFVITGGGISFLADAAKPGTSKWLDGAVVPYSRDVLLDLMAKHVSYTLAARTASFPAVSCGTAYAMLRLSAAMSPDSDAHIAISAKLTYPGERKGRKHSVCIGVACEDYNINIAYEFSIPTDKFPTRETQELVVVELIREAIELLNRVGNSVASDSYVPSSDLYLAGTRLNLEANW